MAITFDPDTGLVADDTATVREAMEALWKAAFEKDGLPELDTDSESPAGQLIDGETYIETRKDSDIVYLANMFNPKTAEGRFQDALAKLYMIERHVAEPTTVTCQVTGRVGTVIPHGAVVATDDGTKLIATSVYTIGDDGTAEIIVRTSDTGEIAIGANTVTQIITSVPGWDTVDNEEPGVTGRDTESRLDFEVRRQESVANNGHGTTGAIYSALANLDDVVACTVLENTTCDTIEESGVEIEAHSIYISIYGGDDDEIAEVIYNKKDCGCGTCGNTELTYTAPEDEGGAEYTYNITRPDTVGVAVKVTIRKTSKTPSDVEELIQEAIVDNFNGVDSSGNYTKARMASTMYASRFYETVLDTGVEDLVSIYLAYPETSEDWVSVIEIPADEMPVTQTDYITVEIEED